MVFRRLHEIGQHKLLLTAIFISFVLLAIFLISQDNDAKMLSLDAKWLLLCGVPIFLALLVGGYVRTFKGLGVEIETTLNREILMRIVSKVEPVSVPAIDKASVERLQALTPSERNKITRLRFFSGRENHYRVWETDEHFRLLKNLKLLEILDTNEKFWMLIPVTKLKALRPRQHHPDSVIDPELLDRLIRGIGKRELGEFFGIAVSDHVLTSDSTIEVYRKIKRSPESDYIDAETKALPILDKSKNMIGLVKLAKVEATIAEEVERTIARITTG